MNAGRETRIGPYRIIDDLGEGGFAYVYRARLAGNSNGDVALKASKPLQPFSKERLSREIRIQSEIDHKYVMPILDFDDGDDPWFTMPIAEGNLANLWSNGSLGADAEAVAQQILTEVGAGLSYAHSLQFLHRDVTPRNILAVEDTEGVGGRRWVVADWGLVRRPLGDTTQRFTSTNDAMGTAGYAAPELYVDAHSVDQSVDVYSLGRIAAWLLTDETPLANIQLLPHGPWRGLIAEATANRARDRIQTIDQLHARLNELLSGPPVSDRQRIITARDSGRKILPNDPVWRVIMTHTDDVGMMLDEVANIPPAAVTNWAQETPDLAAEAGIAMADIMRDTSN